MKKLLIVCIALISAGTFAQDRMTERKENRKEMHKKMESLSPEQKAKLHTKKLTLDLDLSEKQEKELLVLFTQNISERKETMAARKETTERTANQLFTHRERSLDRRIAMKKKMKHILNDEQYEKWEQLYKNRSKHSGKRKMRSENRKK